jgi:beta-lactamase class A
MAVNWAPLAARVEELSAGAALGVSVVAPGGETWSARGADPFPSASTAKIAIMIAVWRMIDRGEAALDDRHVMAAAEKSNGSGVMRWMHTGLSVSLGDLLFLMMAISDNTATNILIRLAGFDAINATQAELGATASVLGRFMVGRLAIEGERENIATAEDYTRLVGSLFDGRAGSPTACAAMVKLLTQQQNGRRIGRFVPTGEGWRWGSKTGSNLGVCNDVGFVEGPAGRMLIAVYTRGPEDVVEGERLIAETTRAAMEAVGLV